MRPKLRTTISNAVPWRVRRWSERAHLSAMRYIPAGDTLELSGGGERACLVAVGDLALGGDVAETAVRKGAAGVLGDMLPVLAGCGLRVGNLESILTTTTRPAGTLGAFLRAGPEMVEVLRAGGFQAVTVANNHSLDFGPQALLESIGRLEEAGIAHCGGGACGFAAHAPAVVETNGLKVGMLGYADDCRFPGPKLLAAISDDHETEALGDIRRLRSRVDLVVVQLHWGYEFALYPLLSHRERARRLADAGADLVLCHHAHVPMGLEIRNGSLIAYGLGNFIFPLTDYIREGHPWTDRSFALQVWFGRAGITRARIVPCAIGRDHVVRLLDGAERARLLGAVKLLSRRLLDTRRLDTNERDRIVREARDFLDRFSRYTAQTADEAYECAGFWKSPRQQDLIRRLCAAGDAGRQAGDLLMRLAQAETPEQAAGLSAESRQAAAALGELPEECPGRTP